MKSLLFIILYLAAVLRSLLRRLIKGPTQQPDGIRGIVLFRFWDPANPGRLYSVVAFVLSADSHVEDYGEIYGPFGFSRSTHIFLLGHLYGRDTWGLASEEQVQANTALQGFRSPGEVILLAGVRSMGGRFVWPLNDPERLILTKR